MGKKLREQIDCVYARLQAVYAALGNIAFWDGKPASATILPNLDWGLPKHTLTLNLTLSNASVKINGTAHANGDTLLAEEYSTLSVLIEAASGHTFATAPTLTFGGQSVTLTANQDGSYSADVVMGQSDATMAVSATGVASYSISYGTLSHCSATTAPTSIIGGTGTATIVFGVDSGYRLAQSGISVTNASIVSYDASTGTLVIGSATDNVTISATATVAPLKFVKGYYIDVDSETFNNTAISVDGVDIVPNFLASDYIKLPQTQSLTSLAIYWGFNRKNNTPNPAPIALFVRENGQYRLVYKRASSGNAAYKSGLQTEVNAVADAVTAMQAGELYARVLHYTTDGTTMDSDCKLVWNGTNITHSGMSYEIVTDPTEIEGFVN